MPPEPEKRVKVRKSSATSGEERRGAPPKELFPTERLITLFDKLATRGFDSETSFERDEIVGALSLAALHKIWQDLLPATRRQRSTPVQDLSMSQQDELMITSTLPDSEMNIVYKPRVPMHQDLFFSAERLPQEIIVGGEKIATQVLELRGPYMVIYRDYSESYNERERILYVTGDSVQVFDSEEAYEAEVLKRKTQPEEQQGDKKPPLGTIGLSKVIGKDGEPEPFL